MKLQQANDLYRCKTSPLKSKRILHKSFKKKSKIFWSDKCQQAFNKLKAILGNTPVLLAPDFNKSFKLAVDASDIGVGAALLQEDNNC